MAQSPDHLSKISEKAPSGDACREGFGSAKAVLQTAIEKACEAWATHEEGQFNRAVLGEMGRLEGAARNAEEAVLAPFREAMKEDPAAAWDLIDSARKASGLRGWGVWAEELASWISRLPTEPEKEQNIQGQDLGLSRKDALARLLSTGQPFWGHPAQEAWIDVQGPPQSLADTKSLISAGYPFKAPPLVSPLWSGSMWWSSPQKNALATTAAIAWRQETLCEESGRTEEKALWVAVNARATPESEAERPTWTDLPDDARHGLLLGVDWKETGPWARGATLERALRELSPWAWLDFWGEAPDAAPELFSTLLARAKESPEFAYALGARAWRQGNKGALLEMARVDEALVDALAGGANFTAPGGWGNADLSSLAGQPVMDGRETIGPVMSTPWMLPFFEPFLQSHLREYAPGARRINQATNQAPNAASAANTVNAEGGGSLASEGVSSHLLMFCAGAYGGEVHACLKACLAWLKSVAQRDALAAEVVASMSARNWAPKTKAENPPAEFEQSSGEDDAQSHWGARRL